MEKTISDYQELFSKKNKSDAEESDLKKLEEQLEKYNYNLAESVKDRVVQKQLLEILKKKSIEND